MTREEQKRMWHDMIDRGVRLIPVWDNKRPTIDGWTKEFTKEERHQWVDKDTYFGFGVACGTEYFGIDIDADRDTLLPTLLEKLLSTRPDLAENCYVEKTPHGAHVIFRCENNQLAGSPLAKRKGDPTKWDEKHNRNENEDEAVLLIESRAKGQQIITWPTEGYQWVYYSASNGHQLSQKLPYDLSPISQADVETICEIARFFDTYEAPVLVKKKATPELSPERKAELEAQRREARRKGECTCDPMRYYGAEFTQEQYEQLLKDYGWQKMYTDSERRIFYQRPGKGPHETDHSGNLADTNGCWLLYVFTTNSELPANCGLAAWQLLMYWQGCTSATCPGNITHEEIRKWKEGWFKEQALGLDKRWGALVENMEIRRRTFH